MNTPIVSLVDRFRKFQRYKDAVDYAFSEQHLLNQLISLVQNTGAYPINIREWKRRPAVEKYLHNLITHFTAAELEQHNNNPSNAYQEGFVNNMKVREVINAFEHCDTSFAAAAADANAQNAMLQGSNADLQSTTPTT